MTRPGASQRNRLIEAMITTAARYGYGGASVARVVKQAGVSRATFYEHFEDKEDCFLAVYQQVAKRLAGDLAAGLDDVPPRAVLEGLLSSTSANPAAARILLLEALAGPPRVRAEHERLLDSVEATIQQYLDHGSHGIPLEIPARALLGGLTGVVAIRLFRGEAGHLDSLLDDLIAWVDSYAVPGDWTALGRDGWAELGAGLLGAEPDSLGRDVLDRRLPRGRGAATPSLVVGEQRQRILAAVARLAREKGYASMTVADIVATASVTREAFYEQFRGKEDAFLAAQAFGLEQSVSWTAGKFFGEDAWRDRVWNGCEAMLGFVAGQSDLVFVDLGESYAAGPAALRRSFENRMAYTIFLEDGYRQRPEAERLPRLCSEAIAGAIHELLRKQFAEGKTERMLELLPKAAYITLAPFVGPVEALEQVVARCPTARHRAPRGRSRARRRAD
jgi:AcrR family transcriptional regulator